MISTKLATLLDELISQTRAGRIKWRRVTAGAFRYRAPSGMVTIRRAGLFEPEARYELVASDRSGEPIEAATFFGHEGGDGSAALRTLWEVVAETTDDGNPALDELVAAVRSA